MTAAASPVAVMPETLALNRAAPSLAAYANTMAGIVKLGTLWHAFHAGDIDTRHGFADPLDAYQHLGDLLHEAAIAAVRKGGAA